jgi:diaminohydroxyphosphoribosylaminopyrimidine deaminase/5-amino-6-(5-phosphoribosylamino)uracil reductase
MRSEGPQDGAGEGQDVRWMRRALQLARRGLGRTHPNPRVGAVAVRDGRLVAEGAHLRFGGPHAEAELLAVADPGELRGATLYVTLEPCAHDAKTPACVPALLRAGIRRVVAAIRDPDPRVDGRGFAELRRGGVAVSVGAGASAAARLNAPFLWRHLRGRALLTLKIAGSLDGRLAAADGSSRWITGGRARRWVHRWRSQCDAVLVGRGTFAADRPRLSARVGKGEEGRGRAAAPQPARIVVDSRASLAEREDLLAALSGTSGGPWVIACGPRAPEERRRRLEAAGARCWVLPEGPGGSGVDLSTLAERLAGEGWLDVLVEGGSALASALVREGLVDRYRVFLAPRLLGGPRTWLGEAGVGRLDEARPLGPLHARRVGRDLLVTAWSRAAADTLVAHCRPAAGSGGT